MDFFANQDAARRNTGRLVLLFVLAVVAIVLAVDVATAIAFTAIVETPAVPKQYYLVASVVTLAVIGIGTLVEMIGVAEGGAPVARLLGGQPVAGSTTDPGERRLVNVVEEMAIASGMSAPQVFVMHGEAGINAFAAGFSPNEAAIAVTRGALDTLSRDELQGVIGHEFSHVLNGDMRLNMRLMGVLGGILVLTVLGRMLANSSSRSDKGSAPIVFLGLALIAIGYIGVFFGRIIQASVSRQREFLADASSVQFTRNPDGIGGALARIGQAATGALIGNPHAEKASHMFFGEAIEARFSDLMATHPPIDERLQRIYGRRVALEDIVARAAKPLSTAQPAFAAQPAFTASGFAGANQWGRSQGGGRRAPEAGTRAVVATEAAAVTGAVGTISTRHIDHAASLLAALPADVRDQLRSPQGAKLAMYGLVLACGGPVKPLQTDILRDDDVDATRAFADADRIQALGKTARLPLITLAIPALKQLPEQERLRFLSLLEKLIEADRRVTLEEFVLDTLLSAALGERAGRAVPVKYRSLEPLAEDARLVLSLIALAGGGDHVKAFETGAREIGIALTLVEARAVKIEAVKQALARLNQLSPMQKPRLVKACAQTALADGVLSLAEAELLRAVCATLDSPLPPFVETMEYAA